MDRARAYLTSVLKARPGLRAKAELDQHFLVSDQAISHELDALGLHAGEQVAELGAGIGTVAQAFPPSVRLALVELDPDLFAVLKDAFGTRENVSLVRGDALAWMRRHRPDAFICNLPWELDREFFATLEVMARQGQAPRAAVAAVHPELSLSSIEKACPAWRIREVGLARASDFWPAQELPARLVAARPR